MTIGVLLAGAAPLSRDTLEIALDAEDDLEVVATTDSLDDTVDAIDAHTVDVAVVDTRVDIGAGLQIARWISAHVSTCGVVILAAAATDQMMVEAYTAHCLALATEQMACTAVAETIRDAAAGLRLVSAEDARAAHLRLRSFGRLPSTELSEADIHLAGLVCRGLTDAAIADHLHLGVQTVRNRVSRLLRSLGMSNRVQLAVFACRTLPPASMMDVPTAVADLPINR